MGKNQSGEPTEAPTPKRLRDARQKGQVARSAELTTALGFCAGAGVLLAAGWGLLDRLRLATAAGVQLAATSEDPVAAIAPALNEALLTVARVTLPIVCAVAALAAVVGYLQVGGLFTLTPVTPDLKRLNPLEGAKRLVSAKSFVELLKSIVKISIVGALAYDLLAEAAPDLARLPGQPVGRVLLWTASLAGTLLLRVALFYAVVGAADYLWQRRQHLKELMMTRDEVKREYKQSEGDPQHKAERKRVHHEISQHNMVQAVKEADVVIVNPDHIAVALRYDEESMTAPTVVAVGERMVAAQIKEVARSAGVPIYRDVPLARSLAQLELGEEIPEKLYEAVAAVLRFVHERTEGEVA